MMTGLIGLSALLLAGIGGIHVYWAFGGRWGGSVAIPTGEAQKAVFRPGKTATLVVAGLLFVAALLLMLQGGLFAFPHAERMVRWGCWICAAVFGLRVIGDFKYVGLFKRVRGSRFATYDLFVFTPLCLWLCFIFYAVL
ncbi:DUF3995 domain-containing protein [Paenibacillus sp. SI8]|uniref:DUF3995 domain-containing protein n=1 Tax=unclassified Paenibacillus TaxID=185978 RepID=UPI0034656B02